MWKIVLREKRAGSLVFAFKMNKNNLLAKIFEFYEKFYEIRKNMQKNNIWCFHRQIIIPSFNFKCNREEL